jgi:hypothetical protein
VPTDGKSGHLGTLATEFRGASNGTPDGGGEGPATETGVTPRLAEGAGQAPERDKSKTRRTRRYADRRTLWKITKDRRCAGCGRTAMDPDAGVIVARTADGVPITLGLVSCGSIWLCPVCSAKIRNGRSQEATAAAVTWIQLGGTALLVTLTARHAAAHELAALMDAIQGTRKPSDDEVAQVKRERADAKAAVETALADAKAAVEAARLAAPKGSKRAAMAAAREGSQGAIQAAQMRWEKALDMATGRKAGAYQRLITGAAWAGEKREGKGGTEEGIRGRVGYIGMIRATEVTLGEGNGFHPHIHALVFVGGRVEDGEITKVFKPSKKQLREVEDHFRAVWTRALEQVDPDYRPSDRCGIDGCKCEGKGHGVRVDVLRTVKAAKEAGEYLAKTQDGKDAAAELTRADMKDAGHGNMTPFQLLHRIGELMGGAHPDEIEGHGTLSWCIAKWHEYEAATKGRRAIEWTRGLRALLGIKGGDTQDDDMDMLFEMDGATEFEAGIAIETGAWHKVAAKALDLAVIEAVEASQFDEAARLVRMAGGRSGSVRILKPGEVRDAWETTLAKLAARREAAAERRRLEAAKTPQE